MLKEVSDLLLLATGVIGVVVVEPLDDFQEETELLAFVELQEGLLERYELLDDLRHQNALH